MKDACRVDIPLIVQLSDDLAPIARCAAVSAAWMPAGAYPLAAFIAARISSSSTAPPCSWQSHADSPQPHSWLWAMPVANGPEDGVDEMPAPCLRRSVDASA
jgi:hypothetical protein